MEKKVLGFTILELIIVIAIIALLTGVVMSSLPSAKTKSRDGKRISDVNALRLGLEMYYDRCRQYPNDLVRDFTLIVEGCPVGVSLSSFISQRPTAPKTGEKYYYYVHGEIDNSGKLSQTATISDYLLRTDLEGSNDALKDAFANPPTSYNYANGQSTYYYFDSESISGGYYNSIASFLCNPTTYHYCAGPK